MRKEFFTRIWNNHKSPIDMFYHGNLFLMIYPFILVFILFLNCYFYLIIYSPNLLPIYLIALMAIFYTTLFLIVNFRNQVKMIEKWPGLRIKLNPFKFWNSQKVQDFTDLMIVELTQNKLKKYHPKRRQKILQDIELDLRMRVEKKENHISPFALVTVTLTICLTLIHRWMDSTNASMIDFFLVAILSIFCLFITYHTIEIYSDLKNLEISKFRKMRKDLQKIRRNHITFKILK